MKAVRGTGGDRLRELLTLDYLRDWVDRNGGDRGSEYTPSAEVWSNDIVEVTCPNSTMLIHGDGISIVGRRGSIEDMLVPLLREADVPLDDGWDVYETTRPDVPWWHRVANVEYWRQVQEAADQ